jgi:hypothetical protein
LRIGVKRARALNKRGIKNDIEDGIRMIVIDLL